MGCDGVAKNILITGVPGCGKTTLVESVVQQFKRPVAGFITKEIREKGRRVGFMIQTLDGFSGIMAHVDIHSRVRVGKYGVHLPNIETIAVPTMMPADQQAVVIIDEIGQMEYFSERFRKGLLSALESAHPVLGTIALKGDTFMNSIKERSDTRVILVTEKNRDRLVQDLLSIF